MDPGASSSSSQSANMLNDSLFELYKPPPDLRINMQVLFFHGFQLGDYKDAHISTWESEDNLWPKTWLSEKFPQAHILTISYNTSFRKCKDKGYTDMYIIAESLMIDLLQENIGQDSGCPVVLIGHSFGGLIIKQLCLQADKKARPKHKCFLENVKGFFFYATPHHGVLDEKLAAKFVSGSLFDYVESLSSPTARLNHDFESLLNREYKDSWRIAGLGEGVAIERGWGLVVPEASSRYGDFQIVPYADHLSITRPTETTSRSYKHLTQFLRAIDHASETSLENKQDFPKLVGADHVMEKVKGKLKKATSLGLSGMGGVGKSTLSKALFNHLQHEYEYTCYINEVKKVTKPIMEVLLEHLYHRGKPVANNEGGLKLLSGKQLLLVLDDVASEEDLAIVRRLQNLQVHEHSRFVASSRDSELLNILEDVFEVPFLSIENSKLLFLSHVFRNNVLQSPPFIEKYVDHVVEKCGGLPLTLEVIGKYLHRKDDEHDERIWKQVEIVLEMAEDVAGFENKLWAKLRVSYDGLHQTEKDMFLDAATIFYKEDLADAKAAWSVSTNKCQDVCWKHLLDLSLVREEGGIISMHEQLLSLGRKIASEGKGHSRVWNEQEAFELLTKDKDSNELNQDIVGLNIAWKGRRGRKLSKMRKLRYLRVNLSFDGVRGLLFYSLGVFTLPSSLIYLRLKYDLMWSPIYYFPSNIGDLKHLTVLKLVYLSVEVLDATLGQLSALQRLIIDACTLKSLPVTLGQLSNLEYFEIHCRDLSSLPDSLGCLSNLQELKIMLCRELVELPKTIGKLLALERLTIRWCDALTNLPNSFGRLQNLHFLEIDECRLLRLPDNFLELQGLEYVRMDCSFLPSIPDFKNLGSLRKLKLKGWDSNATFPKLPTCLEKEITRSNYKSEVCRIHRFDVMGGEFVRLAEDKRYLEYIEMHSRVMEAVCKADLQGALAIWNGAEAEFRKAEWHYTREQFYLLERGVLKRLVGDFHGALDDLTAALELGPNDYECLKHRGNVKCLLGNEEEARADGNKCLEMGRKEPEQNCLGTYPVKFLEFDL